MTRPPPDDRFAGAIKAALAPEFARVATPPAGGADLAIAAGLHLRHLRRVRQVVVAVLVVALALAAAVAFALVLDEGARGPSSAPPSPSFDGSVHAETGPSDVSPSGQSTTTSGLDATFPSTAPRTSGSAGPDPAGEPAPGPGPITTASTVPPPTTTTTTPPVALQLLVSTSDDRSSAVPLDGSTVTGIIYVFYDDASFPPTGPSVDFWIDDPGQVGAPYRVELASPYDLEATAMGGEANGYDTAPLGAGQHTVTVSAGPGQDTTATFTVL